MEVRDWVSDRDWVGDRIQLRVGFGAWGRGRGSSEVLYLGLSLGESEGVGELLRSSSHSWTQWLQCPSTPPPDHEGRNETRKSAACAPIDMMTSGHRCLVGNEEGHWVPTYPPAHMVVPPNGVCRDANY